MSARDQTHCAATHRNAPQRTATHCNALQRTATHRNALQRTATHRNTPQRTATYSTTEEYPLFTRRKDDLHIFLGFWYAAPTFERGCMYVCMCVCRCLVFVCFWFPCAIHEPLTLPSLYSCNTLENTATCCTTLRSRHCNALPHTATHCNRRTEHVWR